MKPIEVSTEIQELPGLFLSMFALLSEVKKRYPQGRKAVAGVENMIADLGEMVVRDTEERKERRSDREEAERKAKRALEHSQREIENSAREAVERERQRRLREVEDGLETEEAPPPNYVSTTSSAEITVSERVILGPNFVVSSSPTLPLVRQRTATFLAHDSGPDLGSSGRVVPGAVAHTRLQNAERLAEQAEAFGLLEAAEDTRRRRATVSNTLRLLREKRAAQVEDIVRRIGVLPSRAEAYAELDEEKMWFNRGLVWWQRRL
jgi:hypothetical protein